MDIHVVDTETTGLEGTYAGDVIIEIAICKLNLKNGNITKVYHKLVGHEYVNTDAWVFYNTDLTPEMIRWAPYQGYAIRKVQKILKGKYVTSYNNEFDFGRFLNHEPWNIPYKQLMPCIMLAATPVCQIPHDHYPDYKWPSLNEAYSILVIDGRDNTPNHRALSDCYASTLVLRELIRRHVYNYKIKKEGKKLWLQKVKQQFNNIRAKKQSH